MKFIRNVSTALLCFIVHVKNVNSALQQSHELSKSEKWERKFINEKFEKNDMETSLSELLIMIANKYCSICSTFFLYESGAMDSYKQDFLINNLVQEYPAPLSHGAVFESAIKNSFYSRYNESCLNYILLVNDVMKTNAILGSQNENKVIVVTQSSQWRVHEYLSSRLSQKIVNLLIISKSEMALDAHEQLPYVLYTHELYIDAIASSKHVVLTSWRHGKLTRPHLNLFSKKMNKGFAGHRFTISLAAQPPFVIKSVPDANGDITWDGLEVRLIKLLSQLFNFTIEFKEPEHTDILGSADAVLRSVHQGKTNLGISGIFVSSEIKSVVDMSNMYYQDCAAFITLTSTALPRYRAILGPFHWSVWICLTLIYVFAILPITFSDKHTLRPLLDNPEKIEDMFWYVFGTFTNAFSFSQKESWTNSEKVSTRIFIGFYWLFTIIISACYTGSIIAFVTLPVYPETIDKVSQLLDGRYRIGILDKGGWVNRFSNSSDPLVEKLLQKVDMVPTVNEGVKNTTKAFFWPYAFLGSKANLDFMVRTQYVPTSKRALLHISDECLTTYGVATLYPKSSPYKNIINAGFDRIIQSGLINKIKSDVEWQIVRSSTGKLLSASKGKKSSLIIEDRALTIEDTQGMFMLLAIGFVLAGIAVFFEGFGGCFNLCKMKKPKSGETSTKNSRAKEHINRMRVLVKNFLHIQCIPEDKQGSSSVRIELSEEIEDDDYENIDRKINELFYFDNDLDDMSHNSQYQSEVDGH